MVDLPGKGEHHFKHPYYGVGATIMLESAKHDLSDTGDRSLQEKALSILPLAGLVIGACWNHRAFRLETPFVLSNLESEVLIAYGDAIAEELQEAGYTLLDIIDLYGLVLAEFHARQSLVRQAQERVAFTKPPVEDSISS